MLCFSPTHPHPLFRETMENNKHISHLRARAMLINVNRTNESYSHLAQLPASHLVSRYLAPTLHTQWFYVLFALLVTCRRSDQSADGSFRGSIALLVCVLVRLTVKLRSVRTNHMHLTPTSLVVICQSSGECTKIRRLYRNENMRN